MTLDATGLPLSGLLRRIRRTADLSQRELAAAAGIAKSTLAAAEAGTRDLTAGALARAAQAAGLRLVLVGADGAEVKPMTGDAVSDRGGRYFPAHLDVRHSDEGWWHDEVRWTRPQPWYTFDRLRGRRDGWRERSGVPDDHLQPQPGDAPADRRAARRREAAREWADEHARRAAAGELPPLPDWVCDCPPRCAELEDWQGPPKHVEDCLCRCDPC